MTDREFMLYAFKGDVEAAQFAKLIHDVAHVWDDLIDKDKPVVDKDINRTFFALLVTLPSLPFFRRYMDSLIPIMASSCLNYSIANDFEKSSDDEKKVMAHTLRYSVADIFTHIALLVGGFEWACEVGPEIRARSQRDTLGDYLNEIGENHA